MNSSHAVAGTGGAIFGAALSAILASRFGLAPDLASAWVTVLGGATTAVGGLVLWWVHWKWPELPPLPGEQVEVSPGAKAVQTAVVQEPAAAPIRTPIP